MQKILRLGLILLLMIPSLIIIPACAKKTKWVKEESQIKVDQAEIDRQKALEQERQKQLEQERQRKEALKKEFRTDRIKFVYEDVYFGKGSYRLQPEARTILKRKAAFLEKYPDVIVIIEGHTDGRGSKQYNFALGDHRAGEVKSFLIREGIERSRLIAVSFGGERPIDKGTTEKARAKNRRVHFQVEE